MNLVIFTPGNSSAAAGLNDLVGYIVGQYPSLADQGVSGYSFYFDNFDAAILTGDHTKLTGMLISMVMQDVPGNATAKMLEVWTPVLEHVAATWPGFTIFPNITTFDTFLDWYHEHLDKFSAGDDSYVGSRLLDGAALTADPEGLTTALKDFGAEGVATVYLVSGKGVWDAKPRGGSNAVLPAWRKAYVHASEFPESKIIDACANGYLRPSPRCRLCSS